MSLVLLPWILPGRSTRRLQRGTPLVEGFPRLGSRSPDTEYKRVFYGFPHDAAGKEPYGQVMPMGRISTMSVSVSVSDRDSATRRVRIN